MANNLCLVRAQDSPEPERLHIGLLKKLIYVGELSLVPVSDTVIFKKTLCFRFRKSIEINLTSHSLNILGYITKLLSWKYEPCSSSSTKGSQFAHILS